MTKLTKNMDNPNSSIFIKEIGLVVRTLPEKRRGRIFPTSFLTLIPIPDKESMCEENHRTIPFMNTDTKILNKISPSQIQLHRKRVVHQNKVAFTQQYNIQYSKINSCNSLN